MFLFTNNCDKIGNLPVGNLGDPLKTMQNCGEVLTQRFDEFLSSFMLFHSYESMNGFFIL